MTNGFYRNVGGAAEPSPIMKISFARHENWSNFRSTRSVMIGALHKSSSNAINSEILPRWWLLWWEKQDGWKLGLVNVKGEMKGEGYRGYLHWLVKALIATSWISFLVLLSPPSYPFRKDENLAWKWYLSLWPWQRKVSHIHVNLASCLLHNNDSWDIGPTVTPLLTI